jgi:hypothetical protein
MMPCPDDDTAPPVDVDTSWRCAIRPMKCAAFPMALVDTLQGLGKSDAASAIWCAGAGNDKERAI